MLGTQGRVQSKGSSQPCLHLHRERGQLRGHQARPSTGSASLESLLLEQAAPLPNVRVWSTGFLPQASLLLTSKAGGAREGSDTRSRVRPHSWGEPHFYQMVHTRWELAQCSPVLERGGGGGLAELAAGTDSDLYRAVSRRSLKRSAAMRALDSSCSGMLLMSEEKGLSGFSRLISQLVFPREDR